MFGGKRSQIRIQISDSGKKLTFPISNNFWIFCRALMLASFFFYRFWFIAFYFFARVLYRRGFLFCRFQFIALKSLSLFYGR